MTVLLLMLVVGIAVVLRRGWSPGRRLDPDVDAAWLTGGSGTGPSGQELIGRYLHRVRTHRFNGALIGGGLALIRGLSHDRHVSIGIGGDGSPLGDLLFGGLSGLLIGSLIAETWRLRPSGHARRAELTARTTDAVATSLRPAVATMTVITVLLALGSRDLRPAMIAATSLVLLLVHSLALRAVAERGRPALPQDLRDADDAIRAFASRRLSLETLAAAVLLAGWQVASVRPPVPELLDVALVTASLAATVLLIHRSRPWPPLRQRPTSSPTAAV